MNLATGEFRALVAKATRGAGYPWGLTDDAAFAATWLAARGVDSAALIARVLSRTDGVATQQLLGPFTPADHASSERAIGCPICIGAAVADHGACPDELGPVVEPLLLAPALWLLVTRGAAPGYEVTWPGGGALVDADGLSVHGPPGSDEGTVSVRMVSVEVDAARPAHRVEVQAADLATLEGLAQRTYAPATEQSRRAGAGADSPGGD